MAMLASRQARLTFDDLDELAGRSHPDNPKGHSIPAIDASIASFGFVTPVVVNDSDGRILEGHGRVEALIALKADGGAAPTGIRVSLDGRWAVPTVHGIDLSPDDGRAFLIAANRTVELGGWDEKRLAALLSDLSSSTDGLGATGFSEADLAALLADLGNVQEGPEPDDIPDEPSGDQLYVERGQLWRLGDHRLLCGDATDGDDIQRLLGRGHADIAICDPPYNVRLGDHSGASSAKRRRTITNDSLGPEDWERFVRAWALNLISRVDGAVYLFMSSREWPSVCRILADVGAHWSDTIIWAKDRFVLGRADYQRAYEPIWYGWREGLHRFWCGDRDQGDVWHIPRPSASDLHPTMKPVALIERAITNSSGPGGRVLDLRRIRNDHHCGRTAGTPLPGDGDRAQIQVCIERWQRYTGRQATQVKE